MSYEASLPYGDTAPKEMVEKTCNTLLGLIYSNSAFALEEPMVPDGPETSHLPTMQRSVMLVNGAQRYIVSHKTPLGLINTLSVEFCDLEALSRDFESLVTLFKVNIRKNKGQVDIEFKASTLDEDGNSQFAPMPSYLSHELVLKWIESICGHGATQLARPGEILNYRQQKLQQELLK